MFPVVLYNRLLIAGDGRVHKGLWRTLPTPNPSYYCLHLCKYTCMHPTIYEGIHFFKAQRTKTLNRNRETKQENWFPFSSSNYL